MNGQTIKKFLEVAVKKGASDLHISCGHPPILRIGRNLIKIEGEKEITPKDSQSFAFDLMTDFQRERFLKEKEVDFAYNLEGKTRFRVNVFFESCRIGIALRLVPEKIKTIEELDLPSVIHNLVQSQQGFVLITGASSQGKSTTLAAMIEEINHQRSAHIITIEDPIEYVFQDDKCLIDQREIGEDALSFPRALRAALRQDPDVIMVGEMRDLETIATALTAAETGHLVLATLHTNSASQTIHRIIDVFPAHQQNQIKAQLSASLLGVISQRLVPAKKGDNLIPACEILISNSAIANLIREGRVHEIPSIIETSRDSGMVSLNRSLVDLVAEKKISSETALKYSLNPQELQSRLEKI